MRHCAASICRVAWRRRQPEIIQCYAIKCAMHYHAHKMVQEMGDRADHFTPSGVSGSCVRRCEVISASVSADVKVSSPRRLAPLQAFSSQSGGGADEILHAHDHDRWLAAAVDNEAFIVFGREVHDLPELSAGDMGVDTAIHFGVPLHAFIN